jgi:hypothetical protein
MAEERTLEHLSVQLEAIGALAFFVEHDLFGKPVSTFPDHALAWRLDGVR